MTEATPNPTEALLTAIRSTDWTQYEAMRAALDAVGGSAAGELRALIAKIEAVKEIMQVRQLALFDVPPSRPVRLGDAFVLPATDAPLFSDAAPAASAPSAPARRSRAAANCPQRIPTEAGRPDWDEIERTRHSGR